MMPATAAAMGMKLISPWILRGFGYRRVLIVNTLMIGVTIGLFAKVTSTTPIVLIPAQSGTGIFQFLCALTHSTRRRALSSFA